MGGNFDWYGTGAALGQVGQELQMARRRRLEEEERQRILREREEERRERAAERERLLREREEEAARRRAKAKLEAAQQRYDLAIQSGNEQAIQDAARALEEATSEYVGSPTQLFTRQGDRLVVPTPKSDQPMTFRDFARASNIQLTPEQDAAFGDRPVSEVIALNDRLVKAGQKPIVPQLAPKPDEAELLSQLHEQADRHVAQIRAARTPAEVQAAVDAARKWKLTVMERYPHLNLGQRLPDFAGIGRSIVQESQAAQTAAAVAEERKRWEEAFREADRRWRDAFTKTDQFLLEQAIADYNALVMVGRQRGWTTASPIPRDQILARWRQARAMDIRRAELEIRAMERRAAGNGERPAEVYVVGPYRVERRGGRQQIIDSRTGVAVGWSVLERRAAAGDQHARQILQYSPPERGPMPPSQMTTQEIDSELQAIETALTGPEPLSPSQRGEYLRRRRELEAEKGRRAKPQQQGTAPSVVTEPPRLPPGPVAMPPTREAGQTYMAWRRTGRPVPRRVWNLLSREEQEWLGRMGVKVE